MTRSRDESLVALVLMGGGGCWEGRGAKRESHRGGGGDQLT